jgi:hypothetical protein
MGINLYNSKQRTWQYVNQLRRWAKLRDSYLLRIEKLADLAKKFNCKEDRSSCEETCLKKGDCVLDDKTYTSERVDDDLVERFPHHKKGDILLICNPVLFKYETLPCDRGKRGLKGKSCIVFEADYEFYTLHDLDFTLHVEMEKDGLKVSNDALCPEFPQPSHYLPPFIFIPHPKSRKDIYQFLPILTTISNANKLEKMLEDYYLMNAR